MKASVVDLRYKMREILAALARNETVSVMYHGKVKAILSPVSQGSDRRVCEHPFFGMRSADSTDIANNLSVEEEMKRLRGGRYDF